MLLSQLLEKGVGLGKDLIVREGLESDGPGRALGGTEAAPLTLGDLYLGGPVRTDDRHVVRTDPDAGEAGGALLPIHHGYHPPTWI